MTLEQLLAGVRDGSYHTGGIRCIRLFRIGTEYFDSLCEEILTLTDCEISSNVADPNHVTHWTRPRGVVTQFSLFNTSGRYDDYTSDHTWQAHNKRFHDAHRYPYLGALTESIPDLINLRINVLGAHSELSAHEEHPIVRMETGVTVARLRFHLPVITTPGSELKLDGHVYHLGAGVCYFINHGCVHSARNAASRKRIHLVWDALLTDALFDFMFKDSAVTLPITRFSQEEQAMYPVRKEPVGMYQRIAPSVTRDEADTLQVMHRSADLS